MENLFWVFISIGLILGSSYFLLIASYCYAWTIMKTSSDRDEQSVLISVVLVARNEEKNISICLDALLAQHYPSDKFEIIVVDDHSTDSTLKIIREYSEKNTQIKYFELSENAEGKKQGISKAIELSSAELIVTTDADCKMGIHWLSSIATFYKKTDAKMIVAPVSFYGEKTIFEKMQSLEFMALIACGGASLFYKKAIMCNGANLAYTKNAFLEVNGFDENEKKASGDDVLLMYKINKLFPGKVVFFKNKEAIVYTKPMDSIKKFVQQRKRWASKGFFALNTETRRVSLLVYLFNAYLVFIPLIGAVCLSNSPFYPLFMGICLILIGIKCIIDFLLLFLSASFFGKKEFLIFFIPEQIIYMLYVVFFGLFGSLGKYEWKGRITN